MSPVGRTGGAGTAGRCQQVSTVRCGARTLPADRAAVMAIIDRPPASFDARGATCTDDAALAAVDRVVDEGADLVDIGGVTPGPGEDVGMAEEIRRVVPFVATVRDRHPELLISVTTCRHEVARLALDAGADIVNDAGAVADPRLAEVAADYGCGVVCSHTGGAAPRTRSHCGHCAAGCDVADVLVARAETLVTLGIPREGILIDPTHNFGKNTRPGLELLHCCDELISTGWPVLMALSDKGVIGIGETLGTGVDGRVDGTLAATTAVAAWVGVRAFRAHQVRETRRVLEMVASIAGTRPPARAVRGR